MLPLTPTQISDRINWLFQVAEQGRTARYGTYGGDWWKQHLPNGVVFPELHPPKKISHQMFTLAQRQSLKA